MILVTDLRVTQLKQRENVLMKLYNKEKKFQEKRERKRRDVKLKYNS